MTIDDWRALMGRRAEQNETQHAECNNTAKACNKKGNETTVKCQQSATTTTPFGEKIEQTRKIIEVHILRNSSNNGHLTLDVCQV